MDTYNKILSIDVNESMSKYDKLKKYQLNHVENFYFSSYDFIYNKKEKEDINFDNLIEHLVKRKHGLCVELTYCFGSFLRYKGYTIKFISNYKGQVPINTFIPHCALFVYLDDKIYYVDVASGIIANILEPINILEENALETMKYGFDKSNDAFEIILHGGATAIAKYNKYIDDSYMKKAYYWIYSSTFINRQGLSKTASIILKNNGLYSMCDATEETAKLFM